MFREMVMLLLLPMVAACTDDPPGPIEAGNTADLRKARDSQADQTADSLLNDLTDILPDTRPSPDAPAPDTTPDAAPETAPDATGPPAPICEGPLVIDPQGPGPSSQFTVPSTISLAVDKKNKVHAAYLIKNTSYKVRYATNSAGSWSAVTVADVGYVPSETTIGLDGAASAHVAYYDAKSTHLTHATNATGSWIATVVDTQGDNGWNASLAVDNVGKLHISYSTWPTGELRYATNTSGAWTTETPVGTTVHVDSATWLSVDSLKKVHIGFRESGAGSLAIKYLTNTSGSWSIAVVDAKAHAGWELTLRLDSMEKPQLIYEQSVSTELRYAKTSASGWVWNVIAGPNAGEFSSFDLDANDHAHVVYYDSAGNDLEYASNSSGAWAHFTVDHQGTVGLDPAVAVDKSGNVHIAYYSYSKDQVRYVRLCPP